MISMIVLRKNLLKINFYQERSMSFRLFFLITLEEVSFSQGLPLKAESA